VLCYSQLIPILGPTLSRLREYSCDRNGAALLTGIPASRCLRPGIATIATVVGIRRYVAAVPFLFPRAGSFCPRTRTGEPASETVLD